ncbi:unnamed protein product [Sphagnum balticum]
MQDVAKKILNKCSGCMLAVSILGSVLSGTTKNESAWKKVYTQFKYYASAKEYTPHDYNGTIFAAIDLSLDHDENKMFSKDLMWSVLQALSLFPTGWGTSSCVVKLAWKSMQPKGETEYFEAMVNSLIHKNLVDGSTNGSLRLHDLVVEYVELKTPIDLFSILCDQEGELKQGRELLAIFLSLYGKRNVRDHVKVLLWRAGAVLHETSVIDACLPVLLDNDAKNAILAVFQLYKATLQDAKALLHLMPGDECSLLSILKHGTEEDVMSVPWILKYLVIGHEEVKLQLITKVGVEKVAKVVDLWEAFPPGAMQELWLKHEGIAKGMILQGTICELLTRVIHQDSEVCMRVLSNLIRYHDDIVAKDLDAKGGLRLFLACYSMQPLNPTWIQLL